MTLPAPISIRGARVWDGERSLGVVPLVSAADGSFTTVGEEPAPAPAGRGTVIDGTGLWVVPGIVDAHAHVAWNDFDRADRDRRSATEREQATAGTLRSMLHAGVTSARDAGGAPQSVRDAVRLGTVPGPRLEISVELLDRAHVDAAGGMGPAVDAALHAGATWIKLVATGGVASPTGSQLTSHFSPAEFALATRLAAEAGARVMVHAWGGAAITAALEAGASSIEHGIFLTDEQARLGAERQATLVPTLRIYRLVLAMIDAGRLPSVFRPRVAEAVDAHPLAVRRARDAGMSIALGSDYSTPDQHGTNLAEIAELRAAGLDADEALVAATTAGARLLTAPGATAGEFANAGRTAVGARADAVLLRHDPSTPDTFRDPGAVVAVIQDGRLVTQAKGGDQSRTSDHRPAHRHDDPIGAASS